jgi:hypothetical protein
MADHPFELLDPWRFQAFCQALLTEEFPHLQCLPVDQADGGRDALARSSGRKGLLVFQMKFSRNPARKDPAKWLGKVLREERGNIAALAREGATEYVLVTNIAATAVPGSGSLDKVDEVLGDFPLPARCLWRDDLNRRLEGAFDLKLSYPELFTGNDFIRILVERNRAGADAPRRQRALSAYLAEQHAADREVRFKQADLQNELFKFYIDVPIAGSYGEKLVDPLGPEPPADAPEESPDRAAALLLGLGRRKSEPRAVVEGAPGQGKSTMLQYVCQIHRLRILEEEPDPEIPADHLQSALRLPFKVELRDYSQWRREAIQGEASSPNVSLERYLAREVERLSGGAEFHVADLQAVVAETSVLLALDGLDEVGDSTDRKEVIAEIEGAVRRLQAVAPSFQAIVTSRPSAFAGPSELTDPPFEALRLEPVRWDWIERYAEKWMDARRLDEAEREEVMGPLREKIEEPHVRDIAQNPMQLAIVLDLIYRLGEALPDQRNALYDEYMTLFLAREVGKSPAVKKYRDLLMLLHGYLAWTMHARAEGSDSSGRMRTDQLIELSEEFLEAKGHPKNLFGELFTRVFERVGALVSRLDGYVEFEVQPLREYFAARYLFENASYSRAGNRRSGSRPELFDAMLRRPYWLNVARFFAGAYDIGELPSLAERLKDLYADERWGPTPHPRAVTARLLADWTFQQEMKLQTAVADLMSSNIAERGVRSDSDGRFPGNPPELSADCGGDRLLEAAWRALPGEERVDRRKALARLLATQVPQPERRARWLVEAADLRGEERERWYGLASDLAIEDALTAEVAARNETGEESVGSLLAGGQLRVLDSDERLAEAAVALLLRAPSTLRSRFEERAAPHLLRQLTAILRLDQTLDHKIPNDDRRPSGGREHPRELPAAYAAAADFVDTVDARHLENAVLWTRLGSWAWLLEEGRAAFGDCPALTDLAIAASGLPGSKPRGGGPDGLFDASHALIDRAHLGHAKADQGGWWKEQLTAASTEEERFVAVALAWSWASEKALKANFDDMRACQAALSPASRARLAAILDRTGKGVDPEEGRVFPITQHGWLGKVDALTFVCAARRMPKDVAESWYRGRGGVLPGETDSTVLKALLPYELLEIAWDIGWGTFAERTRERVEAGAWVPIGTREENLPDPARTPVMGRELARSIVHEPGRYPLFVLAKAEVESLEWALSETKGETLQAVAYRGGWFGGDPMSRIGGGRRAAELP